MNRLALRLCVALATFAVGTTAGKLLSHQHLHPVHSRAEREVLNVERAYLAAHLNHDTSALDRILAEDFRFERPYGAFEDKAHRLSLVADSDFSFRAIDTNGVNTEVDGDRAYVAGTARVHVLKHGFSGVSPWYNYVRTYERRDGRWQIVRVRVTRLGCRD